MISYDTNMMGPWSLDWYRDRGLLRYVWKKVDSEIVANIRRMDVGESYMVEEISTHYAGGRIDIRGLPEEDYYSGQYEYSLPVMHAEDFNNFSEWLDELHTEELMSYGDIMELFEEETNTKIRWFNK